MFSYEARTQRTLCLTKIEYPNTHDLFDFSVFCSHWRSYQFYAESVIYDNHFLAISCDTWEDYLKGDCDPNQEPINMGYAVPYE